MFKQAYEQGKALRAKESLEDVSECLGFIKLEIITLLKCNTISGKMNFYVEGGPQYHMGKYRKFAKLTDHQWTTMKTELKKHGVTIAHRLETSIDISDTYCDGPDYVEIGWSFEPSE